MGNIADAGSIPATSTTSNVMILIFKNWFKKKEKQPEHLLYEKEIQDGIEESLWQIKEEYDLPTEEVFNVVESKRRNIKHMHEMISKKEKYE